MLNKIKKLEEHMERLKKEKKKEKKHLRLKRANNMLSLYKQGMGFKEIGDKHGLTRQRIEQILKKEFNLSKHPLVRYKYVCKQCKKEGFSKYKNRKYCSKKCSDANMKGKKRNGYKYDIPYIAQSKEYRREYARLRRKDDSYRIESNKKSREYYQKNNERMKKYYNEYYHKNGLKYYQENKEKIKKRSREYYHKNKEKMRKYYCEWQQRKRIQIKNKI